MTQDSLPFQTGVAGTPESRKAAEKFAAYAPNARKRCYDYVCAHPESTMRDVSEGLGMNHKTVEARVREMFDKGIVRGAGTLDERNAIQYVKGDMPYPAMPNKWWKTTARKLQTMQPTPLEMHMALVALRKLYSHNRGDFPDTFVTFLQWIAEHVPEGFGEFYEGVFGEPLPTHKDP